ncbi:MAG: manganese efflux pump MntP family protein, partial [Turicibacter sp.]|nr:manganese efflux pump MntP family protein [Turicibacter sp.]
MDAFTVAMTCGMDGTIRTLGQRLKISLIFGIFQGLLFGVGLLLYQVLSGEATKYNSLVAGGILLMLGGHSIIGGLRPSELSGRRHFSIWLMFAMGLATSIDALTAGITFSLLYKNSQLAILIIGGGGIALTYAGTTFGARVGHKIGKKGNIIGGLVIIALGIKTIFF